MGQVIFEPTKKRNLHFGVRRNAGNPGDSGRGHALGPGYPLVHAISAILDFYFLLQRLAAMNELMGLSAAQLRQAADIRERIEQLQSALNSILGTSSGAVERTPSKKKRRRLSAAGRAAIVAAAKARWAGMKSAGTVAQKPRRRMTPAARARLAAIVRARWKTVRATGKNRL